MIWIYASTVRAATVWAREQRISPLNFRATGKNMDHLIDLAEYRSGDTVVLLGDVGDRTATLVDRRRRKAPADIPVIRVNAAHGTAVDAATPRRARLDAYLDADPALPGLRRQVERVRVELAAGTGLQPDWRTTLADVVTAAEIGVERAMHPDDRAKMSTVLTGLLLLFVDGDTAENVFVGGAGT